MRGVSQKPAQSASAPVDPSKPLHVTERPREAAPSARIIVGRFGPVLGVHGGPGMVGVAVVEGE